MGTRIEWRVGGVLYQFAVIDRMYCLATVSVNQPHLLLYYVLGPFACDRVRFASSTCYLVSYFDAAPMTKCEVCIVDHYESRGQKTRSRSERNDEGITVATRGSWKEKEACETMPLVHHARTSGGPWDLPGTGAPIVLASADSDEKGVATKTVSPPFVRGGKTSRRP